MHAKRHVWRASAVGRDLQTDLRVRALRRPTALLSADVAAIEEGESDAEVFFDDRAADIRHHTGDLSADLTVGVVALRDDSVVFAVVDALRKIAKCRESLRRVVLHGVEQGRAGFLLSGCLDGCAHRNQASVSAGKGHVTSYSFGDIPKTCLLDRPPSNRRGSLSRS